MTFYFKNYKFFFMLLYFFSVYSIKSQTLINSENFESGTFNYALWNTGGVDCFENTGSVLSGNDCANLQDNSVVASSMYTNTIDLSTYASVNLVFDFRTSGFNNGHDFFIEFSNDDGNTWHATPVAHYIRGTHFNNNTTYTGEIATAIDANYGGMYSFNATCRFRFRSDADENWDDLYIDNVTVTGYPPQPEINVKGNSASIVSGDTPPTVLDHTDFTTANLGILISRTYTIHNTGTSNLNINAITLSNTTDFSIIGAPFTSPLPYGFGTSFTIQFNSVSLGTKNCTVTITNNDLDETTYQFNIQARAEQNFFDSDGDGIYDNLDVDDDNDGILDADEELSCQGSSNAQSVNYKFLNETFGTGNRTTINTTYDAITTYCFEDGTSSISTTACPSLGDINLSDGEYVVYHKAGDGDGVNDTPNNEVASWADVYWYTGEDHTDGDVNGRMAMFNASYDSGTFYTASIIGALPNIPITYSFWVLNLDTTTAPDIATRLRPDILVEFRDVNNNLLASITTGDIPPSINGDSAGSWHQFSANLTFNVSEFYVYFINNETGGQGNDLAIDDIVISQTLCDTDSDGVADVFDLDDDNDGIPDVVEAGLGNYSEGKATLTSVGSWVDTNLNGMHDTVEGNTVLDSDSDTIPNYLDLDSDNDTVFDADESGAGNTANPTYQNGDGDVSGDGVGDGDDTDAVRETDVNSDGILEYFTDGILDIYDFHEGITMATGYGNANQGTGNTFFVLDSDTDGIPDYMDVTSDGSTFDISHTLYSNLDANSDGIIDGTNDADKDGILDLFDTNDAVFGSPRDLNRKLQLYFDGRNDYAAEATVIDEWEEFSLMSWVKVDPSATGSQIIIGQNEVYIQLNSDKTITAFASGSTINSSTSVTTAQWTHIACSYSNLNGVFKLYINGKAISNTPVSGALHSDTSSFTIGRQPDTDSKYFKGYIDEVRIFNKALSDNELQKMVYQEIENNSGVVRGLEIPRDITNFIDKNTIVPLNWSNLERYYRMDTYKDDIIDNLSTASIDTGTGAKIYNIKNINTQSAPLPFKTQTEGYLPTAVTISSDGVDGNDAVTYDWSIIKIQHTNTHYNSNQKHLGLIVEATDNNSNSILLTIENNSELNVSWYLKLDGKIDLEGDSQLVQGEDSYLDPLSSGTLEKDQQGTADKYTYNYWGSPVGLSNSSTNNNPYKVTDVFANVTFSNSGYDGKPSPLTIADYWIWKFSNQESENYAKWQHARSSGTILPGEGFTMKGPGSGGIADTQNYVFEGKPNNGDINLTINSGNDYLIGNPYPSAIDAQQFILDNGPVIGGTDVGPTINGTLYFWEHWGGGSHILREYQGGYATYTLSGSTPAASKGSSHPTLNTGGTPTKLPGRYIPVGQGFFVTAESTGTIKFNNGQRVFQVEDDTNSMFLKSKKQKKSVLNSTKNLDSRTKIRLGFNSVGTIHRQLLVTVDTRATKQYDWGYDAEHIDIQADDMYWLVDDKKYNIQGVDAIDDNFVMPIGIHTKTDGQNTIMIDKLDNFPTDKDIYLHDLALDIYHDLKQSNYNIYLLAGEYLNRFEITFSKSQTLSTNDIKKDNPIEIFYSKEKENLIINNPASEYIKSLEMFNILGQSLFSLDINSNKTNLNYKASRISTGNYIIKIETEYGVISKKVLIQ